MLSEYLLIPNRHLSFGMLITRLLKQLKFDLSVERSIAPSIDINNTLLKRMHVGEHALIPQLPPIIPFFVPESSSASVDPYVALSAQFLEHSLKISSQLEKISTRQEEIQQGYQNDLAYAFSFIQYLETCVDESFSRHAWPAPLLSGYAQPLPAMGPLFDLWVLLQLHPMHRLLLKIQISGKIKPLL